MKSDKDGQIYYILFIVFILASVVCSLLIIKGILSEPFWFLSIFLIAIGTTVFNKRNYMIAKKETELRRQRRAARKNSEHGRYL